MNGEIIGLKRGKQRDNISKGSAATPCRRYLPLLQQNVVKICLSFPRPPFQTHPTINILYKFGPHCPNQIHTNETLDIRPNILYNVCYSKHFCLFFSLFLY